MLTAIYTIAVVALLFGITIFVHELGHFLVARWCGLVVDVFSIGFGPALWQRKVNGVTYKIGCIPFGGYVALPQLDPNGMELVQGSSKNDDAKPFETPPVKDIATEKPRHLPPISPFKRILVSAAGATGNIILAIILAWAVYLIGKPATLSETSPIIGFVSTNSLAYKAGLRIGDAVRSVNGEPVESWYEFLIACSRLESVTTTVQRGTETLSLTILTERGMFGEQTLGGVDGRSLCMILSADPGMSAARAGLQGGDIIEEFDGITIISRTQLIALVGERKGKTSPITVRRNHETITTMVTPDFDPKTDQVRIGVQFNVTDVEFDKIVHPSPWSQIKSHSTAIFRTLGALTTPGQAGPAARSIGGPLAILITYYYVVKVSLMVAVFFTAFLNVNLAILNLLPIPILDGGHILFCLWEIITRRPVHAKVVNIASNTFAVLLITIFVFLSGRDLWRMTPIGRYLNGLMNSNKESVQPSSTNSPTAAPAAPER
jgi:regulator of sigma E protease